nr:hypothetical protein [Acidisarcina polymorpha]
MQRLEAGEKPSVLAREFGISRMTLTAIERKRWARTAESCSASWQSCTRRFLRGVVHDAIPTAPTC